MASKKVTVGKTYIYYPNLFDKLNPPFAAVPGDLVKVVNLPGCPKANTMGMCHIEIGGKFSGMVCTNSLYTMADKQLVIDAIKADIARQEAR